MMMMISRAVLASRMPLVSSLVALVAAVRACGFDRGACGPLTHRRTRTIKVSTTRRRRSRLLNGDARGSREGRLI